MRGDSRGQHDRGSRESSSGRSGSGGDKGRSKGLPAKGQASPARSLAAQAQQQMADQGRRGGSGSGSGSGARLRDLQQHVCGAQAQQAAADLAAGAGRHQLAAQLTLLRALCGTARVCREGDVPPCQARQGGAESRPAPGLRRHTGTVARPPAACCKGPHVARGKGMPQRSAVQRTRARPVRDGSVVLWPLRVHLDGHGGAAVQAAQPRRLWEHSGGGERARDGRE